MPTNSTSTSVDMRTEALAYASRGFLIFPLWHVIRYPDQDGPAMCACSDAQNCGSPGKHPRTRRGLTEATTDEGLVDTWWSMWPDANIGMSAGANGLAVIDVDPRHGGDHVLATLDQWCVREHGVDIMATRTIRTGSGGLHLIYWQPEGGITSKAKAFGEAGVDTRGRGGYIVAPPSLHASGDRYQVIDNGHVIAPWPAPLTELMEPLPPGTIACGPPGVQPTAGDRGAVWAFAALLEETKKLADLTQPTGDRNNQLNASAYKIGRRVGAGFLDERDAETALYNAVAGWSGHTERELRATIRSGLRAGIGNPHPGPTTRGGAR